MENCFQTDTHDYGHNGSCNCIEGQIVKFDEDTGPFKGGVCYELHDTDGVITATRCDTGESMVVGPIEINLADCG